MHGTSKHKAKTSLVSYWVWVSSEVIQINLFLLSGDSGWTGLWIGLISCIQWVRGAASGAASYLSRSRTLQYYLNLYGLDLPKEQGSSGKNGTAIVCPYTYMGRWVPFLPLDPRTVLYDQRPPITWTRNIEGCHNNVVEMSDGWTDQHYSMIQLRPLDKKFICITLNWSNLPRIITCFRFVFTITRSCLVFTQSFFPTPKYFAHAYSPMT